MKKSVKILLLISAGIVLLALAMGVYYCLTGKTLEGMNDEGKKTTYFIGHFDLKNIKENSAPEILALITVFVSCSAFIFFVIAFVIGVKGLPKSEKKQWSKQTIFIQVAIVTQAAGSILLAFLAPKKTQHLPPKVIWIYLSLGVMVIAGIFAVSGIIKVFKIKDALISNNQENMQDEF